MALVFVFFFLKITSKRRTEIFTSEMMFGIVSKKKKKKNLRVEDSWNSFPMMIMVTDEVCYTVLSALNTKFEKISIIRCSCF